MTAKAIRPGAAGNSDRAEEDVLANVSLHTVSRADTQAAPRTLDDITADIKALMGVTDDSGRDLAWRTIRNSQKECSCCGKCGKQIASGETVARLPSHGYRGWYQNWLVAFCRECAEQDWHWQYRHLTQKPCAGCGRPVWSEVKLQWSDELDAYETATVICCERCAVKARNAKARQKRRLARGETRECQECGETFEPTRTDAKFCSPCCKQKAYRHRVTDDVAVSRRNSSSRNGGEP